MNRRPKTCQTCGATEATAGVISWQGYCAPCGLALAVEAARQMAARSGPIYEQWVANGGKAGRPRSGDGGTG